MKNLSEELFLNLYDNELMLPKNEICSNCDAKEKFPIIPWLVGENYFNASKKVLFVGKPHRGTPELFDGTSIGNPEEWMESLYQKSWPYWRYTRDIASAVFDDKDEPWQHIAFSNIIKCTNVHGDSTNDLTSFNMAKCCIRENGVIFREIEILKPDCVIFYTYSLYKEFLEELPRPLNKIIAEINSSNHRVPCGKKQLPWWERIFETEWSPSVRVLVTGHPERMKKNDYVSLISNWILQN